MYGFTPTDEQKMLIEAVARYSRNDLRPAAHEVEEKRQIQQKLVNKGWELGILQASIPEAYGGFGERSAINGVLAAEELAWGDLTGALAVMTPGLFVLPIMMAGNEQQKQKYIAAVVEGDWHPFYSRINRTVFRFLILIN